ncbi:MAG: glycolate oxidase subunit GlcF [Xanthobacteraceae bacterium]|nr:glycolate oxidase subunit GlcF [Xanthobacteraceae bacterium]MBX3535912.1 glycolate oxidase subunit GlcF [Xanthobacteraceae bacterium]MBX3548678.1 glycolate oxidase subunit GlcF [Xanthobacteraceae bacterium]MCW5673771.1 glycolate oxidase subunit GlcF [Xanthobacteraceae bacterium]MCW5678572.1 glycolate oxidase subunit GlcF [Xanthobacteraceae bacterium]
MQTHFSLTQLADPDIAESDKILRACVHCGFCTATCPTYVLLGDELDSPRGRIYLIKQMLEEARPARKDDVLHIDRCLSCLSCMTTCPSGVHYMHLVDNARNHIEKTYRRPLSDKFSRTLLRVVMPYPARFRAVMRLAAFTRWIAPIASALGMNRIAAMLKLAPHSLPKASAGLVRVHPPFGPKKGRVALMSGCVDQVVKPSIREATIRLLTRHGIEVVLPEGEACCGSLSHHMGREHEAHDFVKNNVDAWTREIEKGGLDAILITASGCGTTVKDYGFMLRTDKDYAEKAAKVSALARDITEYLSALELQGGEPIRLPVAYHSACSMQHGQKITQAPKKLLAAAGFDVRDVPEGHLCCGSAGTYNMLQPEIADRLRNRKAVNIRSTGAGLIATGNVGCMVQIGSALEWPILHTVELLDWATGGPQPSALDGWNHPDGLWHNAATFNSREKADGLRQESETQKRQGQGQSEGPDHAKEFSPENRV